MLKSYVWLSFWLHLIVIRSKVFCARDEREHVHIKVHMPEVVRNHLHQHKVTKFYHQHQHQQQHQHPHRVPNSIKMLSPGTTESDLLAALGLGGATLVPELDLALKHGPALFDNAVYVQGDEQTQGLGQMHLQLKPQQQQQYVNTEAMQQNQFIKQLFSPELMPLPAVVDKNSGNVNADFLVDDSAGGGGGGDGVSFGIDNFLAELRRELVAKTYAQQQHQRLRSQRLVTNSHNNNHYNKNNYYNKPHKRKKYANTGIGESYATATQHFEQYFVPPNQSYHHIYQQQQQPLSELLLEQQQQQKQQLYDDDLPTKLSYSTGNSDENEDDFDEFMDATSSNGGVNIAYDNFGSSDINSNNHKNTNNMNFPQQAQYNQNMIKQRQKLHFDDKPGDVDEFGVATDVPTNDELYISNLQGFNPISHPDMFGAYVTPTKTALTASQPTLSTHLKWLQYHQERQQQPKGHQGQFLLQQQLQQQQANAQEQQQLLPPAIHAVQVASAAAGPPTKPSSIGATTLAANDYSEAYKRFRQKQLKRKRNRFHGKQ